VSLPSRGQAMAAREDSPGLSHGCKGGLDISLPSRGSATAEREGSICNNESMLVVSILPRASYRSSAAWCLGRVRARDEGPRTGREAEEREDVGRLVLMYRSP
jgi:hypothetical protein